MRVKIADSYGIPIFHTGWNTWNIVVEGAPKDERAFCQITFQDARHQSDDPGYAEYMEGVKQRAEHVANVLNAGFAAANLQEAAQAIVRARDFHAEHGMYNGADFHPSEDQQFDDWAADILETALAAK